MAPLLAHTSHTHTHTHTYLCTSLRLALARSCSCSRGFYDKNGCRRALVTSEPPGPAHLHRCTVTPLRLQAAREWWSGGGIRPTPSFAAAK